MTNKEYKAWLASLKTGDVVVLCRELEPLNQTQDSRLEVLGPFTVKRAYNDELCVGDFAVGKSGYILKTRWTNQYARCHVTKLTPEIKQVLDIQRARRQIPLTNWTTLPADKIEAIASILGLLTDSPKEVV